MSVPYPSEPSPYGETTTCLVESTRESFEDVVARRLAEYQYKNADRDDLGKVPNPAVPAPAHRRFDRYAARNSTRLGYGMFGGMCIGSVGAIVGAGVHSELVLAGGLATVFGGFVIVPVAVLAEVRQQRRLLGKKTKRTVAVPADVEDAYLDFYKAEEELRALDTNEMVLARLDEQTAYVEDLIEQIADLTAKGALHTAAADALRSEVLRVGAETYALLVLDRRRHALAVVTDDAQAALQRAPQTSLREAAQFINEEITSLEKVLH